jgi:hypothetical protein
MLTTQMCHQRFIFLDRINKPREKKIIEGNFIYYNILSLISVLSGHFEPSNSRQKLKCDAHILVKFLNSLQFSMVQFARKVDPTRFLSKVLIHRLRLRLSVLSS